MSALIAAGAQRVIVYPIAVLRCRDYGDSPVRALRHAVVMCRLLRRLDSTIASLERALGAFGRRQLDRLLKELRERGWVEKKSLKLTRAGMKIVEHDEGAKCFVFYADAAERWGLLAACVYGAVIYWFEAEDGKIRTTRRDKEKNRVVAKSFGQLAAELGLSVLVPADADADYDDQSDDDDLFAGGRRRRRVTDADRRAVRSGLDLLIEDGAIVASPISKLDSYAGQDLRPVPGRLEVKAVAEVRLGRRRQYAPSEVELLKKRLALAMELGEIRKQLRLFLEELLDGVCDPGDMWDELEGFRQRLLRGPPSLIRNGVAKRVENARRSINRINNARELTGEAKAQTETWKALNGLRKWKGQNALQLIGAGGRVDVDVDSVREMLADAQGRSATELVADEPDAAQAVAQVDVEDVVEAEDDAQVLDGRSLWKSWIDRLVDRGDDDAKSFKWDKSKPPIVQSFNRIAARLVEQGTDAVAWLDAQFAGRLPGELPTWQELRDQGDENFEKWVASRSVQPADDQVATRVAIFDRLTGGLKPGRLSLIAGAYQSGKTRLATELAVEAARDASEIAKSGDLDRRPLSVFLSYEMDAAEIRRRATAIATGETLDDAEDGKVEPPGWLKSHLSVVACSERLNRDPIRDVRSRIDAVLDRMPKSFAQAIFIDYAAVVIKGSGWTFGRFVDGLEDVAEDYDCPIVLIQQLTGAANQKGPALGLEVTDVRGGLGEQVLRAFDSGVLLGRGTRSGKFKMQRLDGKTTPIVFEISESGRLVAV